MDLIKDEDLVELRKKILDNPIVIEALIIKAKAELAKESNSLEEGNESD